MHKADMHASSQLEKHDHSACVAKQTFLMKAMIKHSHHYPD